MKQVILATRNQHKIRELLALLHTLPVRVHTLEDFPHVREVIEDGATLEDNALKKARQVFRESTLPALADDTGLEVHYLNDEPGVLSSRYAGPNASYADNCRKLLERLRGVPPRRRAARFRCVMTFAAPGFEKTVEGVVEGVIRESPAGANGFGYDPIFIPKGQKLSLAEMNIDLKNTLSHRAKAIEKMRLELAAYLGQ
jgi:XTP/dITP diphosphohydrolase